MVSGASNFQPKKWDCTISNPCATQSMAASTSSGLARSGGAEWK
jgi:hypothetical protein